MARGNASINNLLATAQAARDKQLAYNDQAASYDWNLSAKTIEDFNQYKTYLTKRQQETKDPSKQLTAQSKIIEAQRTYMSAEVSRETIKILYGESDNRTKYARINALMTQAEQSGDASLFQTLDATRARLSKTIQDEEIAAQERAASAGRDAAGRASAAFARGIAAEKNRNDMAQFAIKKAYDSGKPLTGTDGQPIKVRFKNGRPELDANGNIIPDAKGQPLRLDGRTFAALKGATLRAREQILMNEADNSDDDNGSKREALLRFQNSEEFNKYATDEKMQRYYREDGGVNPFVTRLNEDGTRDLRPVSMEKQMVVNEKGQVTYEDKPIIGQSIGRDGKYGNAFVFDQNIGSTPDDPRDRYETKLTTAKMDPNAQVKNPYTGITAQGGFGDQQVFKNPKAGTVLPNGRIAPEYTYVMDGIKSSVPLRRDKNGNPVAELVSDHYKDSGVLGYAADTLIETGKDVVDIATNKNNTLSNTLKSVGSTLGKVTQPLNRIGIGAHNPLDAIGKALDYGAKQKADAARRVAEQRAYEARMAIHQESIRQANVAATQRQQQAAAANRRTPSIMYAQPARSQAVPVQQLGTKAAPIGSRPFTETLLPAVGALNKKWYGL